MGITQARQKPRWWSVLAIVPLINLIVPLECDGCDGKNQEL
jgi:hypothetical protein